MNSSSLNCLNTNKGHAKDDDDTGSSWSENDGVNQEREQSSDSTRTSCYLPHFNSHIHTSTCRKNCEQKFSTSFSKPPRSHARDVKRILINREEKLPKKEMFSFLTNRMRHLSTSCALQTRRIYRRNSCQHRKIIPTIRHHWEKLVCHSCEHNFLYLTFQRHSSNPPPWNSSTGKWWSRIGIVVMKIFQARANNSEFAERHSSSIFGTRRNLRFPQ